MAATVLDRAATPTGLIPADLRALRRAERQSLATWHQAHAGDDNGRLWLPGAVRALTVDQRLALADDDALTAAWEERERRRVAADVAYFTEAYGHVRDGSDDDEDTGRRRVRRPLPFVFWPTVEEAAEKAVGARDQREVLQVFTEEDLIAVLKARQLGLTWLALHYGYHLLAFEPTTPNAIVLGLSQDGGYAKRLLERTREINALLPPFLRHAEERETRDSKTEMKLVGRGRMVSLPGTPSAPRSWQCDLAICDEWAFVRNGNAGKTMTALLPQARQVIAISSGNGPAEEPGDGQYFAGLYTDADAGENDWYPIFLPTSTHPDRGPAFRENERDNFDTDEDYLAEHPESSDDALIGAGKDRFFELAHINAALRLGAELDALLGTDDMPTPVGDALVPGLDWGEATAGLIVWPLPGGGIYIPPSEVYALKGEAHEACDEMHKRWLDDLQAVNPKTGAVEPVLGEVRYDSAGVQIMRSWLARARSRYEGQYRYREVRSVKVKFNDSKRGTADYLKRLFRRAHQRRTRGYIAISPANEVLVRQLRGLESAPDGLWKKVEDHMPDALVAGASGLARRHREMKED